MVDRWWILGFWGSGGGFLQRIENEGLMFWRRWSIFGWGGKGTRVVRDCMVSSWQRGNCNLLFLCNPYVVPSLGRASYAWHWGISAHRELGLSFSALFLALGSCNSCFIFTSPTFFSLVKSQSNNQGGWVGPKSTFLILGTNPSSLFFQRSEKQWKLEIRYMYGTQTSHHLALVLVSHPSASLISSWTYHICITVFIFIFRYNMCIVSQCWGFGFESYYQ